VTVLRTSRTRPARELTWQLRARHALGRTWLRAVGVLALVALVIVVGPARLLYVLAHIRPLPALLMAPVAVAISVARAVSWSFALRAGGIDITVGCAVQVLLAARPMVFLPAGDLARVAVLEATTEHRYGAGRAAATVVFQELTFMTLVGIAIVPVLVLYPQLVSVAVLLAGRAAAIFTVRLWEPAYPRAVRLTSGVPLLRRFERDLVELRPSFLQLFNWHTALGVFAFAAVAPVSPSCSFNWRCRRWVSSTSASCRQLRSTQSPTWSRR
jgi:hypothetical protein